MTAAESVTNVSFDVQINYEDKFYEICIGHRAYSFQATKYNSKCSWSTSFRALVASMSARHNKSDYIYPLFIMSLKPFTNFLEQDRTELQ